MSQSSSSEQTHTSNTVSYSSESAENDCVELQHGKQQIFASVNDLAAKNIENMMESIGLPESVSQEVADIIIPHNKAYDLPKEQCVYVPHTPHQNILRITGHYDDRYEKSMQNAKQLVISSEPIDRSNDINSCDDVCNDMEQSECVCIEAEEINANYDNQALEWVTDHIDGGQKYISTIGGNVGFESFSMFSDVIPSHQRMENVTIAPQQLENTEVMMVGGTPIKNILLNHLNDDNAMENNPQKSMMSLEFNSIFDELMKNQNEETMSSSQHGQFGHMNEEPQSLLPPIKSVNLVMNANQNQDAPLSNVKMTAIPLINDNDQLQRDNTKTCTISPDNQQCKMYISDQFDYTIQVENIGDEMAQINLFTVNVPTNEFSLNPSPELPIDMQLEQNAVKVHSSSTAWTSPGVIIGIIIFVIGISVVAFDVILRREKRRIQRQRAAAHHHNHAIEGRKVTYRQLKSSSKESNDNNQYTSVHISLDDQLKYDVFAVV